MARLGVVHRHVGPLEQGVRVEAVLRRDRHAGAAADVDPEPADGEREVRARRGGGRPPPRHRPGRHRRPRRRTRRRPAERSNCRAARRSCRRSPTSRSTMSPMWWPSVSLISLNRSRSIRTTATSSASAAGQSRRAPRPRAPRRLGRPVRWSWVAWWVCSAAVCRSRSTRSLRSSEMRAWLAMVSSSLTSSVVKLDTSSSRPSTNRTPVT